MATYTVTQNLYLKLEDITVLDGGVLEVSAERAADINTQVPGALILVEEGHTETAAKTRRGRKKVEE